MSRKDCERLTRRLRGWCRVAWPSAAPPCATGFKPAPVEAGPATADLRLGHGTLLLCALLFAAPVAHARAGQFRLWSSAVVVSDSIKLGDVAELRGLESSDEEDSLRNIVITDAPPSGGSRIIHHEMIRSSLRAKGVNLAKVTLAGASQCEVRRPAVRQPIAKPQAGAISGATPTSDNHESKNVSSEPHPQGGTLRKAIEDHFHREFARYGGRAEVLFDRSDDHLLELTGPALEFRIRREKSNPLGLCALEIDVIKDGKRVQQIPVVVRTALSRNVLTAHRAINQGAAIVAADVELMPVTFTRLDDLGLDDAALVLGQRAKRFIPSGTRIELETLEAVPLVLRGQLITLVSEVGGVRVVTTAKAGANGIRGETIRVRSVGDSKIEFDAVVTGPGEARAAGAHNTAEESKPRLVLGGRP